MKLIKVTAAAITLALGVISLQANAQGSNQPINPQYSNTVVVQGTVSNDQVSPLTGTNSQGIDTAHGHN